MPAFLKAEAVHGEVYMVDSNGGIWRVKLEEGGHALIQRMETISQSRLKRISQSVFIEWAYHDA